MTSAERKELNRLREKIENAGKSDIDENDKRDIDNAADREILLEFSDQLDLLREEYGDHRHLKLLRHCTRMAENAGGLAEALEDRDAAEGIVRWIHTVYDNEETNRDYRVALRVFGKRVAGVTEAGKLHPPESIAWVSSKTSRSYDPAPDPAEMLEIEDDIKPMIDAARNPRDAALVGVQFEAGLRGGELYDLTIGDISDGDYGLRVRVDGKTGQRTVDLAADFSIPYLQQWLSEHPASDDDSAFLWSKLTKPERFSYQRFLQCFTECAARANVNPEQKPVTPTNFRKSNATWLAKQGYTNAIIEDRQGRERGSKAVARYIANFAEDTEAQYAKGQGIEVEEEDTDQTHEPIECPRCKWKNERRRDFCQRCTQLLPHAGYDEAEAIRQERQDVRNAVLRIAKENPDQIGDINDAMDLMALFDNDPELYDDAREFVEALSEG